jgi:epoxyqueuosine reductase
MTQPIGAFIEEYVRTQVSAGGMTTQYRRPLIGFAAADDPTWARLRQIAEPTHAMPTDLLPGARSVVAFFVPFAESVVYANRNAAGIAWEWRMAYAETNILINRIAAGLTEALAERGVKSASQPPTHNFDPETLICRWSHKSAAAIAGLGSFGLHRMLITDLGCAGRCGSLVVDANIPPTSRPQPERCLYFHDGSCTVCVDDCPAGALRTAGPTEMNLDKHRCNDYLLDAWRHVDATGLPGPADVCGKCAMGPCALGSAV